MTHYRLFDTVREDGVYVDWARVHVDDPDLSPEDGDGLLSKERLEAYRRRKWHYIGIMARARFEVVRNGVAIAYEMRSAGLWGIESDSGEAYFQEVYEEERRQLEDDLKAIARIIGD